MSVCSYQCKDGRKPSGALSTVCNANGNGGSDGIWEPPQRPSCRPQICQPPQIHPQNGHVTCTDENNYGSACSFKCNPGYYLVTKGEGQNLMYDIICGKDSQWSGPAPECKPIKCNPVHRNPVNGVVSCSLNNNYLSRCEFKCDLGFKLVGSSESICNDLSNGTPFGEWSEPAPICKNDGCQPRLVAPLNGDMVCTDGSNYKSACTFECNYGFYMVNSAGKIATRGVQSRCRADNTWSELEPTCAPITCPPKRSAPVNGNVVCTNGISHLSKCSYQCDSGYKVVGEFLTTLCEDDGNGDDIGKWSHPAPRCSPRVCAPPRSNPRNGRVICDSGNQFGSNCVYRCNAGYYMVGQLGLILTNQITTTCQADESWSIAPPTCEPIKCRPPFTKLEGGRVECTNSNNYKSECEFTCWSGFTLVPGRESRQLGPVYTTLCEEDDRLGDEEGRWSDEAPTCKPKECKPRNTLAHGEVTCTNANFATSECTYKCTAEGYALYPPEIDTNICLNDTHWDKRKPCCGRKCPENAEMDAVFILDSSSSVSPSNFEHMKLFIASLLKSFTVGMDTSRFAIFRYNENVDEETAIQFNDFPDSKEGLLEAFDQIRHSGSGTKTGKALKYVNDTVFTSRNGDRPRVPNLVILFSDGVANDKDLVPADVAKDVREKHGAAMLIIGIKPDNPQNKFDEEQLIEIAGGRQNYLSLENGFAGLDDAFRLELTNKVCRDPCDHLTHDHETDNDDDRHVDGDLE